MVKFKCCDVAAQLPILLGYECINWYEYEANGRNPSLLIKAPMHNVQDQDLS